MQNKKIGYELWLFLTIIIFDKTLFFKLFKDDIVISRHDYINFIDFIRAVCLICRNSQEGTRPLILRMAVGAGPLITGRLCLLINRNVLSGLRVFNLWAKSSA